MKEAFRTVYEGGIGEITVKKSRFITTVYPVETEEAAIDFIESLKKKYWDAAHNCSAYIIGSEMPILRCSDDGEPSKTAGRPILDVLIAKELTNLVVIITRYFGGTLLGTGGLVKAYQSATIEGLNQSKIIKKELGCLLSITTDYNYIGKLQYLISQDMIPLISSNYTELVTCKILVSPSNKLNFTKKIAELTNGSALIEEIKQVYFTILDKEVYLFQ